MLRMLLLLPIACRTQTAHSPAQTGMAVWARMALTSPYAVWPARLVPYAPIRPNSRSERRTQRTCRYSRLQLSFRMLTVALTCIFVRYLPFCSENGYAAREHGIVEL
jgi:hypothetical protein